MGFKVASRVRGLSDEAFREAFGAEEQCRSALSRLRWPDGFVCPACGHRGHCVLAGRSLYQCGRCKKQTSSTAGTIFHATKLPLTLWFAAVHLIVTAKNGISSVELGRRLGVKQPDRLDHEAQDHGGDGAARGRHARCRGGWRWTMLTSAARAPAASGAVARRARRPSWRRSPPAPRAGRARSSWSRSRASASARSRAAPSAGWPPEARSSPTACAAGTRSTGSSEAIASIRTGSGRQAARMAPFKWVNTYARQHQERDHRNLPQARPRSCPTLPRQLRLAIQPALPAQHHDPALRSQRRTNPTHPIPSAHRWMTFMDKQEMK